MTRAPLFRDRRTLLYWVLALAWFAIWADRAIDMWRMARDARQGGAYIHSALFAGSALLPLALLLTRDRPDERRRKDLEARRSERLARRVGRQRARRGADRPARDG